ncbi:MAG: hypothetical protein H7343_17050 [Undibacterium sp.]|nr:hypothetical protein [Opitutaceae bacterium]
MRRIAKITAARLPLRKTVVGAAVVCRAFPAWIDAEHGLAFSVTAAPRVTPRVRAGLVLRAVRSPKAKRLRASSDVRGGR